MRGSRAIPFARFLANSCIPASAASLPQSPHLCHRLTSLTKADSPLQDWESLLRAPECQRRRRQRSPWARTTADPRGPSINSPGCSVMPTRRDAPKTPTAEVPTKHDAPEKHVCQTARLAKGNNSDKPATPRFHPLRRASPRESRDGASTTTATPSRPLPRPPSSHDGQPASSTAKPLCAVPRFCAARLLHPPTAIQKGTDIHPVSGVRQWPANPDYQTRPTRPRHSPSHRGTATTPELPRSTPRTFCDSESLTRVRTHSCRPPSSLNQALARPSLPAGPSSWSDTTPPNTPTAGEMDMQQPLHDCHRSCSVLPQ